MFVCQEQSITKNFVQKNSKIIEKKHEFIFVRPLDNGGTFFFKKLNIVAITKTRSHTSDLEIENLKILSFCVEVHCEIKIFPTECRFFSLTICQFCVNIIKFRNFFPKCSSGHLEIVSGNIGRHHFAQRLNKILKV